MLRINPVFTNNIDCKKPQKTTNMAFTAENPIQQNVPDVQPTYDVKTPIAFRKIDELNLPYETKAHYYKLANGQKVIIVPKEGETVLKTYVNTGSMNEPDNVRGISHYIEHNLFNGSDGLEQGDFFKVVDKMGASTNASTGFAETNYFISSHLLNKDDLEQKIKIHASMLETPIFAVEKLEKEKGIVNSEINMILSDPQNIAVNRNLKNLYNIKSSSQDLIGGTTDNITNLTRENIVDYYSNNYYPANMVTVITGEVEPENTMKLMSKYFTSKKQPPQSQNFEDLKPIEKSVREDIISPKATATSIIMGFNGPENTNSKDQVYMEAVGRLLTGSSTSRINKNLKQYNTSAWAEEEKISTKQNDGRAILFSTDATEENSEKIINTIYENIHSAQTTPPTDEEMQVIKKNMVTSFSKIFELSFATNNEIGSAFSDNNIGFINNYEKIVNEMTPQDLVDTAKKYLDLNKVSLTVVHPSEATEESIKSSYNNSKTASANVAFTGSKEVSFTEANKKTAINLNNVSEYKLPNNIILITNETKTRNSALNITFTDDKPIPTAKPATAFILNSLLNEGSALKNDQEYTRELEKKAISASFSSGNNCLEAVLTFDADDMESAIKAAKEVILNPRFNEDALTQVKNDIRDGILKSEKTPYEKLGKALFPDDLAGYTQKEIFDSLDSVTMDDVKALYNSIISNAKADIVVSAPFSKKTELKEILFKEALEFKSVNEFKPYSHTNFKPIQKTEVLTDIHNKNQAKIVEAYKFKTNKNIKDTVTVELMNTILGGGPSSRLFNDLREKEKLAYSVRSNISSTFDSKVLQLSIGTTTENKDTGEVSYDNLKKSIEGFNRHIGKLKTEKVTTEELENAKLSLKNSILSQNESTIGKTKTLSFSVESPYGLNRENELLAEIDKITIDDIYNAANYIFSGKPIYSIVATENTLKENEDFLNSLKS